MSATCLSETDGCTIFCSNQSVNSLTLNECCLKFVFIIIDVAQKVIYKLFLWTLSSTLSLWNSSKSHFSIGLNTVLTHHDPFLEFGTIRSNFWQLGLLVCMKTVKLNNIGRDSSLVEAWSKALDFCTQTHKDLVKKHASLLRK